ncbi:U3 small nucleolar RNA-associated protein 15 -like protein [Babesia sp. Xinjiang]|uniref:U3 small nucleolar RNA-associated protein 15 -like protein n=1 Tax=Babesia sp. Xinjiang TaxID=462227 RepID=UPI000A25E8F3|nr:U3 small nucleolar RNA-associated protein 15 -like protein [Babesia sp. Xinjiang]ORM39834.1 U3 small nucleolar RNA-associated protein 15 -like protein [Babesia sp. Xinjiang]
MGTYVKLSEIKRLRASDEQVYQHDKQIKRFFNANKIVGSGKENSPVCHVAFSPKGNVVSICSATKVLFYNYIEQKVVHTYSNPKEFVRCCAYRTDGKMAAVTDDGGWVQLIALELKSNLKKWRAHDAACHAVHFSSSKVRFMTGCDDGVAKLWDTTTGELVEQYKFHSDKIRTLTSFSGSEHLWVTGGYDAMAYLFDVRDNTKPLAKVNHGTQIEFVEVSENNNVLLTAGGNRVNLWDITAGLKLLYSFEPHKRTVIRGYIREAIITASLDGTVRYFNYSSEHQGGHIPVDERDATSLNGSALTQSAIENTDSSTTYKSDNDTGNESDQEGVNSVKGTVDTGHVGSPQNNIASNTDLHSDHSSFVTPQSNVEVSPMDHFTPMSENRRFSDEGGNTPIGNNDANIGEVIIKPSDVKTASKTEEHVISLRHVYRFSDPVTAFAVSADASSIAVGTSSGEWIIRHNSKESAGVITHPKKIVKVEENLVEYKSPKLTLLDRLVKTFQYQAALDLALSLTPDHVYNLVETLVLRGSLATAVRGKDEQTILPLLKFVSAHLGEDLQNTNTLLELGNAVIDNNIWLESCDNKNVIQELRKIPSKINFELFQHNILHSLSGTLDLILNRPMSTSRPEE